MSSGHEMHEYYDGPRPPWLRNWGPPTVPAGAMRVSDAERADVINTLCRHYGDGRLDEEEFARRQAQATSAKTQADLAPLLVDLPRLPSVTPQRPPSSSRRGTPLVVALIAVVVLVSAASSVAGHFLHPQVPWAVIAIVALVYLGWYRRQRV